MAGSTINITFRLNSDGKGFRDLAKDADGLKQVISSTIQQVQQLKGNVINFAALATGLDAAQRSFGQLQGAMQGLCDAYNVQQMAETKLTTIMRQRMGATNAEIDSIKKLASAQQEIGVIGDEVQLSGAQQMATFLSEASSIETLIPAMNNLLAQQKGLNASAEDAVSVGNLMGKVMQGQTSALKRVGITFTEAQEKVLKYGTESERAAMLAQVITDNVGEMNAELAQTNSGKQQQLANTIGDIKERLGALAIGAMPFVTIAAQSTQALTSITTLIGGIKTLSTTIYASTKAFAISTAAFIKNKTATLAAAAAQKVVSAATTAWTAVQKVLNLVLTANPIGLVIAAIGALVTAVIYAYNNCESFRRIVDKVWAAIKPLATAIMNGLAKAFEWLSEKCQEAWNWLKGILGLGGKKVEVDVQVNKPKKAPGLEGLEDKYKNYSDPRKGGGKPTTPKVATATTPTSLNENASTLAEIEANIDHLNNELKKATVEEAAAINKQIAGWEAKADAIRKAGLAEETNVRTLKQEATTLKDIEQNISILQEQLETASIQEAASINQQIAAWTKKADAIKNAGKAVEDNTAKFDANAKTLGAIEDNIRALQESLRNATIDEAAAINKQIKAWEEKADAIRNAGQEAEKASVADTLVKGWGAIKNIGSSIEGITDALTSSGNAWQKVCGFIDAFIGLFHGVQTVIGIINMLTGASAAHAATKATEAGAETAEAATRATAATENAVSSAAIIAANKLETASWQELAAAQYMAAHAYIPFAGFGIAMGFTTAMMAAVAAAGIPMLADGGIATSPTLAMVGEYAGARNNPEIIAPLDKLRGYLSDSSTGINGTVEFKIKGRTLVGVLNNEANLTRRT